MASLSRQISCGGATATCSEFQLRRRTRPADTCGIHYNYAPHRAGILLRFPKHSKSSTWVAEAVVGPSGAWERYDVVRGGKVGPKPCSYAAAEGGSDLVVNERKRVNQAVEVAVAAAITVVMGVGNRVLYKLALVPLKQYPFFLAQLATFGYSYSRFPLPLQFFFFKFMSGEELEGRKKKKKKRKKTLLWFFRGFFWDLQQALFHNYGGRCNYWLQVFSSSFLSFSFPSSTLQQPS